MPLNEVWHVRPDGFAASEVGVWAERRTDSPLAGVAEDIAGVGGAAIETTTVRVRWRADISRPAIWIDPADRPWITNEVLALDRRRWLDVSISRYAPDQLSVALPDDPTLRVGRVYRPIEDDGNRGYQRFDLINTPGFESAAINVRGSRLPGRLLAPGGGELAGHLLYDTFTDDQRWAFVVERGIFGFPVEVGRFGGALVTDAGVHGLVGLEFVVLDA